MSVSGRRLVDQGVRPGLLKMGSDPVNNKSGGGDPAGLIVDVDSAAY